MRPTTIRGGKIRVMLGDGGSPLTYAAPCGLSQRSITLSKGLNEIQIPSCDNPDEVTWTGRDASSLSIAISGEGVLASESIETWVEAWEDVESVDVRVEVEFPVTTYIWTGKMHVETLEIGANNGERATISVSMQSDGEMVRTSEST